MVKNMNVKKTADLKKMILDVEELIQGEIDWIMKDPEAWRWICHHGQEVISKGHLIETEAIEPEAKMGTKPSFVDVWIEGHKGPDPENPKMLCDEQAKYKENVIQRHGPEFDWRAGAPDIEAIYDAGGGLRHIEAIYDAGGGLRHGRWGLGDGSLEYDRIPRPPRTSQGSSSRRPSRAQQEAQQEETRRLQEETRRLQEETFRLRQNNDYMMTHCLRSLAEMFQSFNLHNLLHSNPINQGTPLGDAQGWLGSNAPEFRPPQLFPQVPPNNFTTPTSKGSPLGDAQGSQPPLNQIIPSG
ncbi:hypothetical protein U9M48_001836 [Paspalum notatum var. saurae]|uniref:Transposase n=1 Tax=Paspalum notatum var. saurae TaxID=547442 RepID=A0AAQ3SIL6_PASNO